MIIYFRNRIAHESYFVLHTAQVLRGNSEEGKPVGLQCLLRGAEFRRARLSHTPPSSNTTLSDPPAHCVRCTSPHTSLILQWMLRLIPVSWYFQRGSNCHREFECITHLERQFVRICQKKWERWRLGCEFSCPPVKYLELLLAVEMVLIEY